MPEESEVKLMNLLAPSDIVSVYESQKREFEVSQISDLKEFERLSSCTNRSVSPIKYELFFGGECSFEHDFGLGILMKEHSVKAYAVPADFVKRKIYSSFTRGGHGYRYLFIPLGELWVEYEVVCGSSPNIENNVLAIAWRQFLEYLAMERGFSYEEARDMACCFEMMILRNEHLHEISQMLSIAVKTLTIEHISLDDPH